MHQAAAKTTKRLIAPGMSETMQYKSCMRHVVKELTKGTGKHVMQADLRIPPLCVLRAVPRRVGHGQTQNGAVASLPCMALPPTSMNLRCKLGRVLLRELGVNACGWRMFMRSIACAPKLVERRAGARDRPRLAQWDPFGPCSLADKSVHTPVKMVRDAIPSTERCLDFRTSPIHAGTRPFDGYMPPISETYVSHLNEGCP